MKRARILMLALLGVVALTGVVLTRLSLSPTTGAQTGASPPARATAAPVPEACWSRTVPLGALPPAVPVWCAPVTTGPPTAQRAPNTWHDDFDHGLRQADIGPGYRVFDAAGASVARSQHFRHNDHWMVDVAGRDTSPSDGPYNFGGAVLRPDQSFHFVDGTLVVEFDVAAGIAEYAGNAWPEVVITTAPAPTGVVDPTYAYGIFSGHWTVGCRLGAGRKPICAMYDDSGRKASEGGRVWEISHFQCGNRNEPGCDEKYGGGPFTPELNAAWRVCAGTDPDTDCRDRFRWEVSKDRLALSVNGTLYMEHRNFAAGKQLPAALIEGEVYVYLASWIYRPDADTVRFHWDHIAVNPAPSAAASPVSPQPAPGNQPTAGPTATGVISFDDHAGQNQALNGQYPSTVIDWGTNQWFHSGPFGAFRSKSVSFTRGRTSSSLSFPEPRRLVSVQAYNGGRGATTVSLSCAGQPNKEVNLAAGEAATLTSGWTSPCRVVTIASSNGWDTNFDDFVIDKGD